MSAAARMRSADPGARRKALVALGAALAVGTALIGGRSWYSEPLATWLLEDPALTPSRGRLLLLGTGALVIVPFGLFALYLWRLGARVIRDREFPPAGTVLLRDTEIVVGDAAVAHGRGLRAIAIVVVAAMLGLAVVLWRVALLLTDSRSIEI